MASIYAELAIGANHLRVKLTGRQTALYKLRQPACNGKKAKQVGEDTMCHIYASQPPSSYECQTRSIRMHGHSTSLRLEAAFWSTLEEMALTEGTDLTKLVTRLHDEVLELNGEIRNFASLLRCCCLVYASHVRDRGAENWRATVQTIAM